MPQPLISRSPDLTRLWEEGYEIEIKGAYLLMHHIPYLNHAGEIKYGVLVSTLNLAGDQTHVPETHVTYFIGDAPCRKDGSEMSNIIISNSQQTLHEDITINHIFSTKPPATPQFPAGYADYYDKMTTLANVVSAPAKSLDNTITERTFQVIVSEEADSVFHYQDSNSARAEINLVSQKLSGHKIAIVGLGGTGSYILDLVAKTPVQEIHLYDGDILMQHNAFRVPGAPSLGQLRERLKKTDYLQGIYSSMHRHVFSHDYYVEATNLEELATMDFVFLSLDRGEARKLLVGFLIEKNIPFADAGMGLHKVEDSLLGVVRVTTGTAKKSDHIRKRIPFYDSAENEYATNIQIADLNALNATLAVIRWKKLAGFYQDFEQENHSTYTTNVNMLLSEDYDEA
jgi:hypothetical protein